MYEVKFAHSQENSILYIYIILWFYYIEITYYFIKLNSR